MIRTALGIAISGLFIWLVIRSVDARAALEELRGASLGLSIPAALVLMAAIWVRSVRWQVLLNPLHRTSNTTTFSALTIGYMANNALPARLGELVRVYVLNRDTRIPATAVLGTIILERIFDVLVLLVLLVVAALASGWESPWTGPLAALGVAAGVLFIIAAAATSGAIKLPSPAASALKRLLRRPFGGALLRISTSLGAGFGTAGSVRSTATILALSVASWLMEAIVYFLVLRAFGIHEGGYWLAIVVTCVSNLSGVIPAGPANIGAFEFFTKEAVTLFGVNDEKALAFAVAAHFVVIVPPTVLGLVLAWRKGLANLPRPRAAT